MSEVEQLITGLDNYIGEVRTMLVEGREADLQELVSLAASLQQAAERLAPEARVKASERIAALMAELVELETELRDRQDEVAQAVKNLALAKQAGAAYRTAKSGTKEG